MTTLVTVIGADLGGFALAGCGADLAAMARYRSIDVPPNDKEARRDQIPVAVVYCGRCGTPLAWPACLRAPADAEPW